VIKPTPKRYDVKANTHGIKELNYKGRGSWSGKFAGGWTVNIRGHWMYG